MYEQLFEIKDFESVQYEKMLFVAKHENFKAMSVAIVLKMVFYADVPNLLSQGKQLAKGKTNHFLP